MEIFTNILWPKFCMPSLNFFFRSSEQVWPRNAEVRYLLATIPCLKYLTIKSICSFCNSRLSYPLSQNMVLLSTLPLVFVKSIKQFQSWSDKTVLLVHISYFVQRSCCRMIAFGFKDWSLSELISSFCFMVLVVLPTSHLPCCLRVWVDAVDMFSINT